MQILYIQHDFWRPAPLPSGEMVHHAVENLRAITHYCAPLSRGFYVPFFGSLSAIVTNRRVRVGCRVYTIPFTRQTISLWFPGHAPGDGVDTLVSVTRARGRHGPCLELLGRNPQRRTGLFSAPELRVRVYGDDLEALEAAITGEFPAGVAP